MAVLNPADHITLEQAAQNLLAWMAEHKVSLERPVSMSAMGYAAFPAAHFKSPQGAALAVSKLASRLFKERLIAAAPRGRGDYPTARASTTEIRT